MTRVEFLTELDHRLSTLTKEQADEYLAYYAEMMADRMEDGMSEEEAVASLESPSVIASRILGTVYTTPQKKTSDGKWFTTTALAICAIAVVALAGLAAVSLPFFSFHGATYVDTPVTEEVIVDWDSTEVPLVDVGSDPHFMMDTDGIRALEISWISGNINFEFWDGGDIAVYGYGADSMTCVGSGDTLYINYESSQYEDGSCDLVICLPYSFAQTQLDRLSISTTSANVYLYDLTLSDLTISTISGLLDMYGCFDTVSITSTSGDVTLNGSATDVTINSVSGNVFLTCDHRLLNLNVNTVSADMSIFLPVDLGFYLEFSSVSGDISSGSLDLYAEKNITHSYGDGKAELYLETISGYVYLELQ